MMVLYVKQYQGKNPMRVHKLAKEFNVKSSDLLKELKSLGINISSHMSGLDSEQLRVFRIERKRKTNKENWTDNMQSASKTILKEDNRLLNALPQAEIKELPVTFWEWIRYWFGFDSRK